MRFVQVRLPADEMMERMSDMRLWLDGRRFEPSRFSYAQAANDVVVTVEFKIDAEARAFAERFAGYVMAE